MPVFAYKALDSTRRYRNGTLTADTPADGRRMLRERGLSLVAFQPARTTKQVLEGGIATSSRRNDQVAEAARYLALLLRAGVPLEEGLDVVSRHCPGSLATVVSDVRDRLASGGSLAESLQNHPGWFDDLFISAVRVGEISGNLDEALTHLADHLRARQSLRGQVQNALTYPLILTCLGAGVVIFLTSYVIPQLLTVLEASGRSLPASTRLLKGVSDMLVHHWLLFVLLAVAIVVGVTLILRSRRGLYGWHVLLLRWPLIGPLVRKQVVAEFAQQMALLLHTGIPFLEALRSVRRFTRNQVLARELDAMAAAVESGSDIAPTMKASRVFPPVVAHLVAVGQDSGSLTEMLEELRVRYESEVQIALTKFTAALEPLLIVVLASAVGFVVFACMMPILEATRAIG